MKQKEKKAYFMWKQVISEMKAIKLPENLWGPIIQDGAWSNTRGEYWSGNGYI